MTRIYDPRETEVNIANAEARDPEWALVSRVETYTLPSGRPDGGRWPGDAAFVKFTIPTDVDSDYASEITVTFLQGYLDGTRFEQSFPGNSDNPGANLAQALRVGDLAVCEACGQWIVDEGSVGWVTLASGDDGGTYDLCLAEPFDAPHTPTR